MIVVLSLNTALDRMLVVSHFEPGRVYRAEKSHVFPAGKGLNVVRVLSQLGTSVRVVGFLGGAPTTFIQRWCDQMGIEQRWTKTGQESRTCVIVVDPESGSQTVLNEVGPRIRPVELDRLQREIEDSTSPGDTLCISGSAPPGVPDGFYSELTRDMNAGSVRVLADLGGKALRFVSAARPWALAPNREECAAALSSGE